MHIPSCASLAKSADAYFSKHHSRILFIALLVIQIAAGTAVFSGIGAFSNAATQMMPGLINTLSINSFRALFATSCCIFSAAAVLILYRYFHPLERPSVFTTLLLEDLSALEFYLNQEIIDWQGLKIENPKNFILHQAIIRNKIEVVKHFINENNVNDFINPRDQKTALDFSMESRNEEMCTYLLSIESIKIHQAEDGVKDPFYYAFQRHNADLLKLLLQHKGCNKNALYTFSPFLYPEITLHYSALHYCVAWDWEEGFRLLVEYGADVNIKNKDLDTPLHIAANRGCLTYVKSLLNAGAEVNAQNIYGRTPLHMALYAYKYQLSVESDSIERHQEVVRHLGDHCNVNTQDIKTGDTPLHTLFRLNPDSTYRHLGGFDATLLCLWLIRKRDQGNLFIKNISGQTPFDYLLKIQDLCVVYLFAFHILRSQIKLFLKQTRPDVFLSNLSKLKALLVTHELATRVPAPREKIREAKKIAIRCAYQMLQAARQGSCPRYHNMRPISFSSAYRDREKDEAGQVSFLQ